MKIRPEVTSATITDMMAQLETMNVQLTALINQGLDEAKPAWRTLVPTWSHLHDLRSIMQDLEAAKAAAVAAAAKETGWRICEVGPEGNTRIIPGSYATRSEALDGVLTLIREDQIPEGYEVQVFHQP